MWMNGRPTSSSQISSLNSRGSAKRDIDAISFMSLHDKASKFHFPRLEKLDIAMGRVWRFLFA